MWPYPCQVLLFTEECFLVPAATKVFDQESCTVLRSYRLSQTTALLVVYVSQILEMRPMWPIETVGNSTLDGIALKPTCSTAVTSVLALCIIHQHHSLG